MAKKQWSDRPSSVFLPALVLFFLCVPRSLATTHRQPNNACFVGYSIHTKSYHRSRQQAILSLAEKNIQTAGASADFDTTTAFQGYTKLPRLYVGQKPMEQEQQHTIIVSESLRQGAVIPLTPDQSHYVTKVMRIGGKKRKQSNNNNNYVRIFDGVAGEWLAEVIISRSEDEAASTRRKRAPSTTVNARCVQQLRSQTEDTKQADKPWIMFAPLKKARAKIMMEKCTELGVGRIIPIVTDRTESASTQQCTGGNMEKLAMQLVEASEQCERLDIPNIAHALVDLTKEDGFTSADSSKQKPWTLKRLLDYWENEEESRSLLVCRERSAVGSIPVLQALEQHDSVAYLIGPEGGWSPEEEALFDERSQNSNRVQAVSLGSLVLRAETAAAAATAASVLYNDMR